MGMLSHIGTEIYIVLWIFFRVTTPGRHSQLTFDWTEFKSLQYTSMQVLNVLVQLMTKCATVLTFLKVWPLWPWKLGQIWVSCHVSLLDVPMIKIWRWSSHSSGVIALFCVFSFVPAWWPSQESDQIWNLVGEVIWPRGTYVQSFRPLPQQLIIILVDKQSLSKTNDNFQKYIKWCLKMANNWIKH
jgi:hypothetical protein